MKRSPIAQSVALGGRWFDPRLDQCSFRGWMIVIVTAVHCFDNGYVGKQPVAWKEYRAEYWLKELQESMDRCTGSLDVIEILLKNGVKHHTINECKLK